jgi:hypothetical protein
MTRRLLQLLRNLFRKRSVSRQEFVSIALLLKTSRPLREKQLCDAARRAGSDASDRDTDAIAASVHGPIGVVRRFGSMNPYYEDVVAFAASVSSPEARQAILDHGA